MAEQERPQGSTATHGSGGAKPAEFPEVEAGTMQTVPRTVDALGDVDVTLTIQLGTCRMFIRDILQLRAGSTVELEKLAGEQVDVHVNDAFFAKGEVVVLADALAVRITEITGDEDAQGDDDEEEDG